MPKKHTGRIGGFAAQNSGVITDCYSLVKVKAKKQLSGGFIGENTGIIQTSFANKKISGLVGGFSGSKTGHMEACYFFHSEKEESKKLKKLIDPHFSQQRKRFKDDNEHLLSNNTQNAAYGGGAPVREPVFYNEFVNQTGGGDKKPEQKPVFDLENIWEYISGEQFLRFIPDNWFYDLASQPSKLQDRPNDTPSYGGGYAPRPDLIITSADDLFEFARRINEGDKALTDGYIVIDRDIDLRGKAWIPIGHDITRAFSGVFDGGGHTVSNFIIKDRQIKDKGFFGFLKGEVYNLTVDLKIKGGSRAGGIAAHCEGGVIGCCAAVIAITTKGRDAKTGNFGGLVGTNTGRIFQSYAAGKIAGAVFPWWLLLPLLLLLLLIPRGDTDDFQIFPPPPIAPGVVPLDPGVPRVGTNFVSFEFERIIDINLATGECRFYFRNPPESNHDILVQLQMTDAEAIIAMGSTGRTAEEQQRLDAHPDYDPENYRTILAEAPGVIPVGYMLDNLFLSEQPNGARLAPGEYPAIVFLIFYDINTHSRAMLESQLPVTIRVR